MEERSVCPKTICTGTHLPQNIESTKFPHLTTLGPLEQQGLVAQHSKGHPLTFGNTGGEGSFTQQVHCEYIGGSETIRPDFTQQAHARYFLKVPINLPSKNPPGKM